MTAVRDLLRTNRLDIVAVGVDQERGEIGRAVIGPRAGGAVVAAAGLGARAVKFPDRRMVRGAEGNVSARAGGSLVRIEPKRGFALGPEARAALIVRAQHVSERRQRRGVETHAGVEIFNLQSDVVVHDDLQWMRARTCAVGGHPSQCPFTRSWKILRLPNILRLPSEACRNRSGEMPAARWKVRTKLERSPNPTS